MLAQASPEDLKLYNQHFDRLPGAAAGDVAMRDVLAYFDGQMLRVRRAPRLGDRALLLLLSCILLACSSCWCCLLRVRLLLRHIASLPLPPSD